MSFLIVRNDLSLVEAEFIRPRAWIESLGLVKGARLDLAVPELGIDGLAEVTAVRDCPPIAEGEGRVVTGRFVTRDVANVVRITLANGTEIRATDVHPVWSVDREDWVPAGKLKPGELVDTLTGPVAVASVEPLDRHPAVYNLEVHGEHVYRIAVDGVLVHNSYLGDSLIANGFLKPSGLGWQAAHIVPKNGFAWAEGLDHARGILKKFNLIDDYRNGFWAQQAGGHAGTHTKEYCQRVVEAFRNVTTESQAKKVLESLWNEIKVGSYWQ